MLLKMLNSVCKRLKYIQDRYWKAHTVNWTLSKFRGYAVPPEIYRSNSYTYENHVLNTVLIKNDLKNVFFVILDKYLEK